MNDDQQFVAAFDAGSFARQSVVLVALLCIVAGCGRPAPPATTSRESGLRDEPLSGGGTAGLSLCGQKGRHHFSGPPPPKDSATPQMVVVGTEYSSTGGSGPRRLTIRLSIASGGGRSMSLSSPLGADGPSVEIQGSDGVVVAAHGLPIKAFSGLVDGKPQVGPSAPFSYEVVVPSAAACPGHSLAEAMGDASVQQAGASTLTVTVSDPAIARHRAAHGGDASGALLVASWPPDPNAIADGAGTAPDLGDLES